MELLSKMNDKKSLRAWAKQFDKSGSSEKLMQALIECEEYKNAQSVMLFYPLKKEVNLLALLKDKTKNFYLPKIDGENMLCCPFNGGEELCISCFNTKEPASAPVDKSKIDLVIVPALCCDKNNYRLGYGGGFYDRFLNDYKGKTIVCLPKNLIVDTICPESYDIPVDTVITC